jgi:hypothetical protein
VERAHTADPAHKGIIDHLLIRGRDCGIECITPFGKNRRAGIGGARLRTNYDALHGAGLLFDFESRQLTRAGLVLRDNQSMCLLCLNIAARNADIAGMLKKISVERLAPE